MTTREEHLTTIRSTIDHILSQKILSARQIDQAENIVQQGGCTLLTQTNSDVSVSVEEQDNEWNVVQLKKDDALIFPLEDGKAAGWDGEDLCGIVGLSQPPGLVSTQAIRLEIQQGRDAKAGIGRENGTGPQSGVPGRTGR